MRKIYTKKTLFFISLFKLAPFRIVKIWLIAVWFLPSCSPSEPPKPTGFRPPVSETGGPSGDPSEGILRAGAEGAAGTGGSAASSSLPLREEIGGEAESRPALESLPIPESKAEEINYKVSSLEEMERLRLQKTRALSGEAERHFGEKFANGFFFKKAGLIEGSKLSNDFIRSLPLPGVFAMFNNFSIERLGAEVKRRQIRFPLSDKHALHLENFFENYLRESVTDGQFETYLARKLNRDLIMRVILSSSRSRVNQGSIPYFGFEIYGAVKDPEGGMALSKDFKFSLQTTDMALYYMNLPVKARQAKEEALYDQLIETLESRGIEAIGVNMYHNYLPFGVLKLASYIKKKGMDVHVLGYCGMTCSNYLLPAAKNVYIEQHGLVLYRGFVLSFIDASLREWLDNLIEKAKEDHDEKISRAGGVLRYFNSWGEEVGDLFEKDLKAKGKADLLSKVQRIRDSSHLPAPVNYGDFSEEELKAVYDFLFWQLYDFSIYEKILSQISYDVAAEKRFFQDDLDLESSDSKYSYMDFLRLSDHLTRYPQWVVDTFSPLERSFYNVSESEKFLFLIPDTQLLKDIGINVVSGENSAKKLDSETQKGNIYLELSAGDIENCDFFSWRGVFPRALRSCTSLSE